MFDGHPHTGSNVRIDLDVTRIPHDIGHIDREPILPHPADKPARFCKREGETAQSFDRLCRVTHAQFEDHFPALGIAAKVFCAVGMERFDRDLGQEL